MGIKNGSESTPLNAINLLEMKVPPIRALDMSRSLYLTIGKLLKDEYGELDI